jgi:hypothetical protein
MSKEGIAKVISKYLPANTVDTCTNWIVEKNIHLRITRGRASKYGDYKPDEEGNGHRISVNHDLNPYSFLITFTHEVAHLHCFTKYRHRHEPHGKEWKNEFAILLNDFIRLKIFPEDIELALRNYVRNPAASSCSDQNLHRVLKKYNPVGEEQVMHLEELESGTNFCLYQSRSGLVFRKGEKKRTRFECIEVRSKREYLVSGLAEVIVLDS